MLKDKAADVFVTCRCGVAWRCMALHGVAWRCMALLRSPGTSFRLKILSRPLASVRLRAQGLCM